MRINLNEASWLEIGKKAGWIKSIKTAYRRNAPQNTYKTPYETLEEYANRPDVDTLYISYVSKIQSNVAIPEKGIRDVESPKVGINPRSHYNTPLGVYTYPLKEIWPGIRSSKNIQSVPFKGDSPYIAVLKRNDKCKKKFIESIQSYSETNLIEDENLLKVHFVPALLSEDQFQHLKEYAYSTAAIKTTPLYSIWNLTRILSVFLALLEKGDILKDTGKWVDGKFIKDPPRPLNKDQAYTVLVEKTKAEGQGYSLFPDKEEGKLNIPSVKWNKIMSKILNYAGFADKTGEGFIHKNERTQAVFFEPTAYVVLENIKNRSRADTFMRNYSYESQKNIWETLKKLPAGHRSEKMLEDILKLTIDACPTLIVTNISVDVTAYPLINSAKQKAIKYWIDKIKNESFDTASKCPIRDITANPEVFNIIKTKYISHFKEDAKLIKWFSFIEIEQDPEIKSLVIKGLKELPPATLHEYIPKSYKQDILVWEELVSYNPEFWSACYIINPELAKNENILNIERNYWKQELNEAPQRYNDCDVEDVYTDPSIIESTINAITTGVFQKDNGQDWDSRQWGFTIEALLSVLNSNSIAQEVSALQKPKLIDKIKQIFKSNMDKHTKTSLWGRLKQFDELTYNNEFWEDVLSFDVSLVSLLPWDIAEENKKLRPLIVEYYKKQINEDDFNLMHCNFYSIKGDKELLKANTMKFPLTYGQMPIDIRADTEVIKSTIEWLKKTIADDKDSISRTKTLINTYLDWFPEQSRKDAEMWGVALSKRIGYGLYRCPKELLRSEPVLRSIKERIIDNLEFADQLYRENIPEIQENVEIFAISLREYINCMSYVDYELKEIIIDLDSFKAVDLIQAINSIPERIQKNVIDALDIANEVSVIATRTIQNLFNVAKDSGRFNDAMHLFKMLVFCENLVDINKAFGGIDAIILEFKPMLMNNAKWNNSKVQALFFDLPEIRNSNAVMMMDKELQEIMKTPPKTPTWHSEDVNPIESNIEKQQEKPEMPVQNNIEKQEVKTTAKKNTWNSFFITSSIRNISEIL